MILGIDVHHDPKVFFISHLNLLLKGLGHKLISDVGPLWCMVEKAMYCQNTLETWFAVTLTALLVLINFKSLCQYIMFLWNVLSYLSSFYLVCNIYRNPENNMLFQHQNFLGFQVIWNAINEKNLEKNFNEWYMRRMINLFKWPGYSSDCLKSKCIIIVSEDIWESVWVTIIISFHKFLYVLMIDNGCAIYNRILW